MFEDQEIVQVAGNELLDRIRGMSEQGYRLVQIGCTQGEGFQIDYTFDKGYKFLDLRLMIPLEDPRIPSITGIYSCAFTYENELHDLFGIQVDGISLNYGGKFYRIPLVAPFRVPGKQVQEPTKGDSPGDTVHDKE